MPLTPAESAFLDLALAALRATNSAGRRALRIQLESMIACLDLAHIAGHVRTVTKRRSTDLEAPANRLAEHSVTFIGERPHDPTELDPRLR